MLIFQDNKIPLSKQFLALEKLYKGRAKITDNDRTLIWEGKITPTPLSREYGVVIKFTLGSAPKCIVTTPNLTQLSEGREIPHIYEDDEHIKGTVLCLFLPELKDKNPISEWQPNYYIADTIIPWASLWLTYFEEWLYSDDWQGGGEHPTPEDDV